MTTLFRRLRHVLGDPAALVYLALCAALLVWALAVTGIDDSGESMAGVVPILATAPFSLVFLALPDHAASFFIAVVLGSLIDGGVIGWCARTLRKGPRAR